MLAHTLLASLALFATPQDTGAPETVRFEFGWPREGRVPVFEETTKNGATMKASYELVLSPDAGGAATRVEYDAFKIRSLPGVDLTDPGPAVTKSIVQLEAVTGAIPGFRIDAQGSLVDQDDFGPMLASVADVMRTTVEPEVIEQVLGLLRQPQFQEMMQAKAADRWHNWVGHWVDIEFEPGSEEVWEIDTEISGGVIPELELRYGERVDYRGVECIEISMSGRADEDLLMRTLLSVMGEFSAGLGADLPKDIPFERATKTVSVHGFYAIEGLRPLEVQSSEETSVLAKGQTQPEKRVESHAYYFDWPGVEPHGKAH